jgi:cell division protein FtsL
MAIGRLGVTRTLGARRALVRTSSRGLALWTAFVLLAINAAGLLLVVQVANLTTESYELERLEAERQRWLASNYDLEAESAELQSLNRVEREAREKLKMVPAGDFVFVAVSVAPPPAAPETPAPLRRTGEEGGLDPLQALRRLLGVGE